MSNIHFNFKEQEKKLEDYLISELSDCDIINRSQNDDKSNLSNPICRFIIKHRTTKLIFSIRIYYGEKMTFRCWGLDNIFWAIDCLPFDPDDEFDKEIYKDIYGPRTQVIDISSTDFPNKPLPIKITPDENFPKFFEGYFVEDNLDTEDIDVIIKKIKIACTKGIFSYRNVDYDFKEYIPFFNPHCRPVEEFEARKFVTAYKALYFIKNLKKLTM